MTGSTAALACRRDHLLDGALRDHAEQRRLQRGDLVGDGVDELAQLLGGGAGRLARTGRGGGPSPPRGPRRRPSPTRRRRRDLVGGVLGGVLRTWRSAHGGLSVGPVLSTLPERRYAVHRVRGHRTGSGAFPGARGRVRREATPGRRRAGRPRRRCSGAARTAGDDPVERPGGEDEFVAAPDEVEVLRDRAGQRQAPDEDAVLGGSVHHGSSTGPGARSSGAGTGERGQVVGAARVAAEVGESRVRDVRPHSSRQSSSAFSCWAARSANQGSADASGRTRLATRASTRRPCRARPVGGGAQRVGAGRARVRRPAVRWSPASSIRPWTAASSASQRAAASYSHSAGIGTPASWASTGRRARAAWRSAGQQAAQVAAQLLGQGEQGEGLGERGQVDDEEVVAVSRPVALGRSRRARSRASCSAPGSSVSSSPSSRAAPSRSRTLAARSWSSRRFVAEGASAASGRQVVQAGGGLGGGAAGAGRRGRRRGCRAVGGEQQGAAARAGGRPGRWPRRRWYGRRRRGR